MASLVSCTAVKVAPKEGDTADRAKYRQGIKFYDPEIVGDTPETVEARGIANLLEAFGPGLREAEAGYRLLSGVALDAAPGGRAEARLVGPAWGPLDDVVMGGVSESTLVLDPALGALVFRGTVSTRNSGGFASCRSRNWDVPVDLSPYDAIRLKVRGNGLRYKLTVRTEPGFDSVAWSASFDTAESRGGAWEEVDVPLASLVPTMRAAVVPGIALDRTRLQSLQIVLSKFEYAKGPRGDLELNPRFREGPFELPIAAIAAVRTRAGGGSRLVHVSSAGVTRPDRPGIDVEKEPPAVKLNDALGG